jgi:hypothetical protein
MKARAARLLVLCCITALAAATGASGRAPLNPVCNGTKIDPVVDGTYAMPFGDVLGSVTIHVFDTPEGQEFSFYTNDLGLTVASIVAKGGTASSTMTENVSADSGLHAPVNPNSGYWYDLSYLCFTNNSGGGGGGGVG